jgi:hypothetical protein
MDIRILKPWKAYQGKNPAETMQWLSFQPHLVQSVLVHLYHAFNFKVIYLTTY